MVRVRVLLVVLFCLPLATEINLDMANMKNIVHLQLATILETKQFEAAPQQAEMQQPPPAPMCVSLVNELGPHKVHVKSDMHLSLVNALGEGMPPPVQAPQTVQLADALSMEPAKVMPSTPLHLTYAKVATVMRKSSKESTPLEPPGLERNRAGSTKPTSVSASSNDAMAIATAAKVSIGQDLGEAAKIREIQRLQQFGVKNFWEAIMQKKDEVKRKNNAPNPLPQFFGKQRTKFNRLKNHNLDPLVGLEEFGRKVFLDTLFTPDSAIGEQHLWQLQAVGMQVAMPRVAVAKKIATKCGPGDDVEFVVASFMVREKQVSETVGQMWCQVFKRLPVSWTNVADGLWKAFLESRRRRVPRTLKLAECC